MRNKKVEKTGTLFIRSVNEKNLEWFRKKSLKHGVKQKDLFDVLILSAKAAGRNFDNTVKILNGKG